MCKCYDSRGEGMFRKTFPWKTTTVVLWVYISQHLKKGRKENPRAHHLCPSAGTWDEENWVCQKEHLPHMSINRACSLCFGIMFPAVWVAKEQLSITVTDPSLLFIPPVAYIMACVWSENEYKRTWRVHREKPVTLISSIWFPVFLPLVWPQVCTLSPSLLIKKQNHLLLQLDKLNILSK